ncbi:MAG: NUDIX domain-containing protein [Patescibacteria group bacterium]
MPHIHEKIDFTVEVFIVHKNKVLLRMHDKFKIWCSIGGHIELDEDPVGAAIREVKEETGLDIEIPVQEMWEKEERFKPLAAPRYLARHTVDDIHTHVILVYFAKASTDILGESMNAHEQANMRWVTKEEVELMDLVPNIRFYAGEALKKLSS